MLLIEWQIFDDIKLRKYCQQFVMKANMFHMYKIPIESVHMVQYGRQKQISAGNIKKIQMDMPVVHNSSDCTFQSNSNTNDLSEWHQVQWSLIQWYAQIKYNAKKWYF